MKEIRKPRKPRPIPGAPSNSLERWMSKSRVDLIMKELSSSGFESLFCQDVGFSMPGTRAWSLPWTLWDGTGGTSWERIPHQEFDDSIVRRNVSKSIGGRHGDVLSKKQYAAQMETGQSAHSLWLSAPLGATSTTESCPIQSHSPPWGSPHLQTGWSKNNSLHFGPTRDSSDGP